MNYDNYPIQLSNYNLIPLNPATSALLEEANRIYLKETFCALPSKNEELELKIVYKTINEFYSNNDITALCLHDPILSKYADELDPDKNIDRNRLDILLLDHCDGLRCVLLDDGSHMWRYIITRSPFEMSGLIGSYFIANGVDADIAEAHAREIADDLALNPHKIRAVALEKVEIETFSEGIFDFPKEDDWYFAPNAEALRSLVEDFMSKSEQDSFLKIAEEFLADLPHINPPDQ